MKARLGSRWMVVAFLFVALASVQAEVMMQWFETEWEEMYRKLPVTSQIGYDHLWVPPPSKAPTGLGTKWGNVGYSLYDRFDIGDMPQRGSYATRYGTRGDLRNMVDAAHRLDIKILPDIIMNHNGNGPDIRYYPGMTTEDYHVEYSKNYCNDLNYKRAPGMYQWYHQEGYGGTMWQDLANLVDIRTEDHGLNGDRLRFTGQKTIEGVSFNFVGSRPNYYRHIGQYDKYPYAYTNEMAADMLYRWIAWLGNAVDYDGLRLDAGKHVPYEFFGWAHAGFLHEAQYSFSQRRGFNDNCGSRPGDLFNNYLLRTNALIFAEILSPWSEIEYWFKNGTANPMRFLDYQIKKTADGALNGSIGNFYGYGTDFGPNNGIMYIWGHDEGPASKANLGYAYILTHIGMPMVYYTGNNINWDDYGRSADKRTWMVPGHDSQAMGDVYNDLPNLVWINQTFARGSELNLWHDNDVLAYERYDDSATSGKGLVVVALNDSGWDQTKTFTGLHFADGTVLHDYTGHNASDVTVNGGSASFTIPGMSGQGWVCYAPRIPESLDVQIMQGASAAPTMTWVVPGGVHAAAKTQQVTRITTDAFKVNFTFTAPAGGSVDAAMMKWGQGRQFTTNYFDGGRGVVSGQYEKMEPVSATAWKLDVNAASLPEGLTAIKCRAFVQRPAGYPALFNTFTKVVYVDRRGPDLVIQPTNNQVITGDYVMLMTNSDFLAQSILVDVDGAQGWADKTFTGVWRYNLQGLTPGAHTVTIRAYEADWANSRQVINTSVYTRAITVVANPNPISIAQQDSKGGAIGEGSTNKLPWLASAVNAVGSPSSVKLYWNGYEIPFNAGNYSNVFNGEVIFRDFIGQVVTDRFWGAFCNGANYFEAVRTDGAQVSRATRRVVFNLYGINAIDSDGDTLPDNLEMPFIDTEGKPGADQPWPGDSNRNFIPEWGENWTRLNPYNHSTFYSGTWDDNLDTDGDGYKNYDELYAGFTEGNIYKYNIYDSGSKPSGSPITPSTASWAPETAVRGSALNITYTPNDGPLKGKSPVYIHIGHSAKTLGTWTGVYDAVMTQSGATWTYAYPVSNDATSVDFVFNDGASIWDNNNGSDWQANVEGAGPSGDFAINGDFDGANGGEGYTVFPDAMKILAAVKGNTLYVATWSTEGNDVFMYVTDQPGDAKATPWAKAGYVFFDTASKPYLTAESTAARGSWLNNVTGICTNGTRPNHPALEATFNLVDAFGTVPEAVYIASVAYGTDDAGGKQSQGPYAWEDNDNVDTMEMLRVPIASIRDEDLDGYFDGGKPQMWTVVNGNTNDANYGLRRFFINEQAGDTATITVILQPNVGGTSVVSNVELFSNLNRRDFAVLPGDETPDSVTVDSQTTYYRAYPMTSLGGGKYSYTLTINKCGAYRINARYKVNGTYYYYTDNGLRRDCAVVVTPKKALDCTMYELNPMIAEAKDDSFAGRSTFRDMYVVNTDRMDVLSTNYFRNMQMNMIWLQPIHPIGAENRQTDPATSSPYDPGSPYAVKNYWQVSATLGNPSSVTQAMNEFCAFVGALDSIGVGVMLDGTFNHSAWDCEIGEIGVQMGIAPTASTLIRSVRPQWFSKRDAYGQHATYYESANNTDIAPAPDRIDFGKWNDAADFFFGAYDCLVQGLPTDTNWAWSSAWYSRYLFEEDRFDGFKTNATRELWEYFSQYPLYWLEKTGHPEGTPKSESYKGIDGLRCDFAQGLPSLFWEYTINKTRSVKWDFLFMAESLDGYREVGGSKRHGVGYRSCRHFDILNENMVFYWRDNFFNYGGSNPQPYTQPTWQAFDNRRNAFDVSPVLLNLTSHDEIYPQNSQWRILYAYSMLGAIDGVPMLLYGQEAGAQNDAATYAGTDAKHNFRRYEINFGKSIPNFKRYNHMTNVWHNGNLWMTSMRDAYGRINRARLNSPALRSQQNYFLVLNSTSDKDSNIFAVAKYQVAGVSAASQEVVLAFVNNNFEGSASRWGTFRLNAESAPGVNWFGIQAGHNYNIVDLMATNPTTYIWGTDESGANLIANGITVGLTGDAYAGQQAQYLRLIDRTAGVTPTSRVDYFAWDRDGDGLPAWWKDKYGLSPADGPTGDKDEDGVSNGDEYYANTNPNDANDVLEVNVTLQSGGVAVSWPSETNLNYHVEEAELHMCGPAPNRRLAGSSADPTWHSLYFGTALSGTQSYIEYFSGNYTNRFYRVRVQP